MALNSKYGTVTTEFGDIPDDEIVIILRGRDELTFPTMTAYVALAADEGATEEFIADMLASIEEIRTWQQAHPDRMKFPSELSRRERG